MVLKLKDLIGKSKNKSNNQSVWNPKKRILKKNKITEEDLLNMDINKKEIKNSIKLLMENND